MSDIIKDNAPILTNPSVAEEQAKRHAKEIADIAREAGKNAKIVQWGDSVEAILTSNPIPENNFPPDLVPATPFDKTMELTEIATKFPKTKVETTSLDGKTKPIKPFNGWK